MELGEKLLELRKSKGLSQEDVANVLNVSRQTVSKWETGQSVPDLDKIIPICELFEITTEELLKGIPKEEKNGENEENNYREYRKKRAFVVSLAVFLYFLSLVSCIILTQFNASDDMIGAIFMTLIAIPTCLLIYFFMANSNRPEKTKKQKLQKNKIKSINSILLSLTIIIYFLISFLLKAWHISWIIFIILFLVIKVIDLLFMLGDENNEKE